MSRLNQLEGRTFVVRFARLFIWVCLGVAVVVGALSLVFGTIDVLTGLVSGHTAITLIADTKLPPAADHGLPRIVTGHYETASAIVTGLPVGIAALAAATSIVQVLPQATIAALVAMLAWRLLRGAVFARSLSLTIALAGAALLVGGLFSQGFGSIAAAMAARELNGAAGRGFWPLAGRIDFTPLVLGIVLVLVGLAFEYGERLQRDTDGLI